MPMSPEAGFRRQMPQIGATRDEAHPHLSGHSLEAPKSYSKTLILGIARPFSDVEPVDKKRLADVCRVTVAV
jgi:hypothetical protein